MRRGIVKIHEAEIATVGIETDRQTTKGGEQIKTDLWIQSKMREGSQKLQDCNS